MSFQTNLEFGAIAEGAIAGWLRRGGFSILPAYQIEQHTGKGPQLFTATNGLVAPDMLAFGKQDLVWVEAKHKSVFTWYRKTKEWTTGIDLRHYEEYKKVQQVTGKVVWIFFHHPNSTPSQSDRAYGCPSECPTGLFGGNLDYLSSCEHHRCLPLDEHRPGYLGHGRSGMVYWAHSALQHFGHLPAAAVPA